jgi:CRISPR/Cas system-associated exonuclease Cas4 (RecB family)
MTPGIEDEVLLALRSWYVQRQGVRPLEVRAHFYASEAGDVMGPSACHRKLWYRWHGVPPEDLTPDGLLALVIGDVIGERIGELLLDHGVALKVEEPWALADPPLTGRADAITWPTLRRVVEVKTVPARARKHLPRDEHVRQLALYYYALHERHSLEGGTLLYVVKDATKGMPVVLTFDFLADELLAVARETREAMREAYPRLTGIDVPDRPQGYSPQEYPCSYCSYRSRCWGNANTHPQG